MYVCTYMYIIECHNCAPTHISMNHVCTHVHTTNSQVCGAGAVHTHTEKVSGVSVKDGVEDAVVEVAMLLPPVVVEVDKVLQVVVCSEVVDLLLLPQDSHTHHLAHTGGHQGVEGRGTLGRGCGIRTYIHTYVVGPAK